MEYNAVPVCVSIPKGTYEIAKKMVNEEKIAVNFSDYVRQLIAEDLKKRNKTHA